MTLCSCDNGGMAGSGLGSQLSNFGDPHNDFKDSEAGLTCMVCCSDLGEDPFIRYYLPTKFYAAPDDDPGIFCLLELGAFVSLGGVSVVLFSGLRRHAGYPSTSPVGRQPMPWSYRFVLVCYPPHHLFDGNASIAMAVLPTREVLRLSLESLSPLYVSSCDASLLYPHLACPATTTQTPHRSPIMRPCSRMVRSLLRSISWRSGALEQPSSQLLAISISCPVPWSSG